jgi:hypothetical protein
MDPIIVSGIIAAGGVIVGAIIQSLTPPNALKLLLTRTPKRKSIVGDWDSFWGPTAQEVRKYRETITITAQRGDSVWGKAVRPDEPDKAWDIEGRCEGDYIQMLYFPAKEAKDRDFQDYGSYFLKKKANGVYSGFSTGFGKRGEDSLSTDFHEMVRRK